MILHFQCDDEEAMVVFGADLALALRPGDFVALNGDLGTGKSTLARALIRTLAGDGRWEVPSPTFSLLQHYQCGQFNIAHADLYRLASVEEVEELGLTEILEDGILLVEWPQKGEILLPPPTFNIFIDYAEKGRRIRLEIKYEAKERFARSLAIRHFLQQQHQSYVQRYYLAGDASSRRYETIVVRHQSDGNSEKQILMDALQMHPAPFPQADINKREYDYAQTVNLARDVRQFAGLARLIRDNGFYTPQILASDFKDGLLLIEHLGEQGIVDEEGLPIDTRYLAAAELLADIHATAWLSEKKWPDLSLRIPAYDRATLFREASLLLDWYLPCYLGQKINEKIRKLYGQIWHMLIDQLQAAEQGLCLRDYHSPNIIWRRKQTGHQRIGLIDFQDALIGPVAYDLASLAQDARATITPELETAIIDTYCARRRHHNKSFDEAGLRHVHALAATQRIAKVLGLFVRLAQRDGKPGYLKHLPRLLTYLRRNLVHPHLRPLYEFCRNYAIL